MGGQATLSVECQAIPWIKLTLDLLSGLGEGDRVLHTFHAALDPSVFPTDAGPHAGAPHSTVSSFLCAGVRGGPCLSCSTWWQQFPIQSR